MVSIQLEEESSQDLISKYNEWLIVSYNHHGCLVVTCALHNVQCF